MEVRSGSLQIPQGPRTSPQVVRLIHAMLQVDVAARLDVFSVLVKVDEMLAQVRAPRPETYQAQCRPQRCPTHCAS